MPESLLTENPMVGRHPIDKARVQIHTRKNLGIVLDLCQKRAVAQIQDPLIVKKRANGANASAEVNTLV
jgi:hypothetical protein